MPSGRINLEAILSIIPDESKARQLKQMMDDQEASWSRIESTVSKIGDTVGEMARFGAGLVGVAGISSLVGQFFSTSQYGSNLALAAGRVTGGASTWHPYGQSLLSAQARTGVASSEIAQGLIQAIQSVGGNPTPNQAAVLGGLLAGYGQTTGMTPSQVAQVVAPLLQASNKPLTGGNILGIAATMSGGLSNFPGSQAAPMLGLLSNLGVMQALGAGPAGGFTTGLGGLTAAVNSAAGANSLWRNPSITGGAINSISGGLQNAYSNPSLEAFMQMAGIPYEQQRKGFTPQNMNAIMSEATKVYGTGPARDVFLRSIFGLSGADFLEQFSGGSPAEKALQNALAHPESKAAQQHLQSQINHAQAATTPNALANKAAGGVLGWLFGSPAHLAEAGGGLLGLNALRKRLPGLAKNLFGGGATTAGDAAASGLTDAAGFGLGDVAGLLGSGGLTAIASLLINPDMFGGGMSNPQGSPGFAVMKALQQAQHMHFKSTSAAEAWLHNQFGHRTVGRGTNVPITSLWNYATGFGDNPRGATQAQDILTKFFDALKQHTGGDDPIQTFDQASKALLQAANKMGGSHRQGASYTPGSSSPTYASLGTPATQLLGSGAPSLEFASLLLGSTAGSAGGAQQVTTTGGSHAAYVSLGGSTTTPGRLSHLMNLSGGGGSGGGTLAQQQAIAAAAAKYGIPYQVLDGIFGAESTFGTAYGPGQNTYGYFGLTSPGLWNPSMSFGQDAMTAASTLAADIRQRGGNLNAGIERYSGNGYGLAHVRALAGGAVAPGQQPQIHVHVHIDGKKQRAQRVLAGHSHIAYA